jgi:hypothetical protein
MALCIRCSNIDLQDANFYALSEIGVMKPSAKRGCGGCAFFLGIVQRYNLDAKLTPDTQVLLRRIDKEGSKVWLHFLSTQYEFKGNVALRLCWAYGES